MILEIKKKDDLCVTAGCLSRVFVVYWVQGDLSSNSYSGVLMTAFWMINAFLVNPLERFDMGKNSLKYRYVVHACAFESAWPREKFIYLRAYFISPCSLEGYKFVYNGIALQDQMNNKQTES